MIDPAVIEQDLKRLYDKMSENCRLMHFMLGMLHLYETLEHAGLLDSFICEVTNIAEDFAPFVSPWRTIVV